MSTAITAQYRDINTITQAFRFTAAQAQRMALTYVIQMGQLLTEAKELLDDSREFERWLAEEAECKKSTAYNYMKIAAEYGGSQVNLFGDANSTKMGQLTYSQAVALLALPAADREEFVEQNEVESMSTRELKQAIAERDEARKTAEQEKAKAEAAEKEKARADAAAKALEKELNAEKVNRPDVSALEEKAKAATENSKRLEKSLETAQNETEKVQEKLNAALAREKKLNADMQELREHPVIPSAELEKMGAEAQRKAQKEYSGKLAELEKERDAAAEEIETLKKRLAQSSEEVTIFRTYLTDVSGMLNKLSGIILKVEGKEPETADKLKKAAKCILTKYAETL